MKKILTAVTLASMLLSLTECSSGEGLSEIIDQQSTDSTLSQSTGSSSDSSGNSSSSSSTSSSGSSSSTSSSSSSSGSGSSSSTSSSSSSSSSSSTTSSSSSSDISSSMSSSSSSSSSSVPSSEESPQLPEQSTTPVHQHQYSKETVAATCTTEGYTVCTCSCGDQYTDDIVGALGHNYTQSVVNATCTAGGYTVNTCTRCNTQYTSDQTYATGHRWGDWVTVKEPTVSSEGEMVSECGSCGEKQRQSIPKVKDLSAFASEVVGIVNAERAKEGLSPLDEIGELNSYAELRSSELVNNFAHERPDGSSPLDYVMGMSGIHRAGENIAMGYGTPEAVMVGWMNSPGHHANIMNPSFTMIGVGCYESNGTLYWTQIFAG